MTSVFGQVSYTVQDELGITAPSRVPFTSLDTTTISELGDMATTVGGELDLVTSGKITGVRVELYFPVGSGWKSSPTAGSRVEQTGLVNFFNATTKYRFGIDFPALADSLISGGKILIDSGALRNLCNLLIAGVSDDNTTFCNTAQQALTSIADALVSFRKHRAVTDRRTKVVE